jgi:pseudouridine synthase
LVYNKTRGIVVTRQKEGQTQGEEQKALSEILQELNLSSFKWVVRAWFQLTTMHALLTPPLSQGRLDVNTEGLLLLTNDGMLKRHLELPSSGYLRKYRVRVFGRVDPALLKELAAGVTIDGVHYKPITAEIESTSDERANSWLTMTLSEGKNREIKRVLEYLRLKVTRLIRVQYGPYGLGEIESGSSVPQDTRCPH